MPKALKPTFERMKADKREVTLNMPFQPSRKWGHFFKMLGLSHLCFHCLRVTKVTRLRREGVPREVAMRLVNHSSELIHLLYDRHRVDDLRVQRCGALIPVGAHDKSSHRFSREDRSPVPWKDNASSN
jgi:integrase